MIRAMLRVAAVIILSAGCTFPVQGGFIGRELPEPSERSRTILIIFNHGFSNESAGTYRPKLPPILVRATESNPDVVIFAQVRNTARLDAVHHSSYIEAAVDFFQRERNIPVAHMILVGQSCGGWGSLQAAAFTYPEVGGVVAFAPTCHGQLPHSTQTQMRRLQEISQIAGRTRFPGVIFVYEGDSYYQLDDWAGFESKEPPGVGLRVLRLHRNDVFRVCSRCTRDSHGAAWDTRFADEFFEWQLQPLIETIRARIRAEAVR